MLIEARRFPSVPSPINSHFIRLLHLSRIPPLLRFTVPRKLCSWNIRQTFFLFPLFHSCRYPSTDPLAMISTTRVFLRWRLSSLCPTTTALSRWMFSQIHNPRHIFRLQRPAICSHAAARARACVCKRVSQFATNCQLQIIEIQFRVAVNASTARWNLNDEFAWRLMISSQHQQAARTRRSFSKSKSACGIGAVWAIHRATQNITFFSSSIQCYDACRWMFMSSSENEHKTSATTLCGVLDARPSRAPTHSESSPRENVFGMQRNERDKNWWKWAM